MTSTGIRILGVLGVAIVAGALTPIGELVLPGSVNAAANSSGPWATIVFAAVFASRIDGWLAAVLGAASFVLMDVSFFVVFDLLGGYYPHSYLAFWVFIAIVVGPIVGLCASWLHSDRMWRRTLAVAAPCSILIGEGIFMLHRLPGVSTYYALASVGVGTVLLIVLAIVRLRHVGWAALSIAGTGVASFAFFAIYGLLPLVLHKTVP